MAVPRRQGVYHDSFYARGNDIAGDIAAGKLGKRIDHDVQQCRPRRLIPGPRRLIVTHWPEPESEHWLYDGKPVTRPFRDIPLERVLRMECRRDGHTYHIRTPEQTMCDAKRLGVPVIEFEFKFTPTQRQLNGLAAAARRVYGDDWQWYVEIKMLQRFDWQTGLARAKAAGFTTMLIGFDGNALRLTLNYPFVDYYRR